MSEPVDHKGGQLYQRRNELVDKHRLQVLHAIADVINDWQVGTINAKDACDAIGFYMRSVEP